MRAVSHPTPVRAHHRGDGGGLALDQTFSRARSRLRSAYTDENLFISSLTVAEIRRGVLEKPAWRKRDALKAWFGGPEGPPALFAGRVLPFDEKAALIWASLMADARTKGRSRSALDTIIAATARANDCVVVTDNEGDFSDVEFVNPTRAAGCW